MNANAGLRDMTRLAISAIFVVRFCFLSLTNSPSLLDRLSGFTQKILTVSHRSPAHSCNCLRALSCSFVKLPHLPLIAFFVILYVSFISTCPFVEPCASPPVGAKINAPSDVLYELANRFAFHRCLLSRETICSILSIKLDTADCNLSLRARTSASMYIPSRCLVISLYDSPI